MAVGAAYKLTAGELDEQWLVLQDGGPAGSRARDRLVLHYQPLVWSIANHIGTRLPAHVDNEDLASYGMIGLLDAIEKFDLGRGLKFQTYAGKRISGQIFDELRKLDWVPRSVHSQVREVTDTVAELERQHQRPVTDTEVAEASGLSRQQVAGARSEQSYISVMALDALLDNNVGDETLSLASQLYDRTQAPEQDFEVEGIKALIAGAMSDLAEREAVVLALYYIEGLTLSDIGGLLGVTESRVCQMHTRAMVAVRERLAA
jgi:RNA polymerase sigma factor for flagellar operon FliA